MKPRLLITGASGFLGWNLCRELADRYEIVGTRHRNRHRGHDHVRYLKVDIADYRAMKTLLDDVRPDCVIHTAAHSNTNECQNHPIETARINVTASANLAGLCEDRSLHMAFTSTDLVFDGKDAPYSEAAQICPMMAYGEQKAMAEIEILQRHAGAAICRVPLMYGCVGPGATNFTEFLFATIAAGKPIPLFVDEFRTPLSAVDAASGLALVLAQRVTGKLHLAGADRVSRLEFGQRFCEVLGFRKARMAACRQRDVPMLAPRPSDVSLDISLAESLGFSPRQLDACLGGLRPTQEV
ncbi:MAG: dTDP-4-dehydrorhamnose reductase [Rhodothermales bacterium]|jgi:dTDP-4-dehydrorhamnose reductase